MGIIDIVYVVFTFNNFSAETMNQNVTLFLTKFVTFEIFFIDIMSVIIRLQNLPWAANAADIRHYFQGLSIPEGGVHIVGGEKGDAFISFRYLFKKVIHCTYRYVDKI